MTTLVWTGPARRDVFAINDWLTQNASAEIAASQLAAIAGRARILLNFPLSGPSYQDTRRKLSVRGTPYNLIYRVRPDGVQILRIVPNRAHWQDAP